MLKVNKITQVLYTIFFLLPFTLLAKDSKPEIKEKEASVVENPEEHKRTDSEAMDIKKKDHEYFSGRPFFKLSPIRVPIIQNGVWMGDIFCRLDCKVENAADYDSVSRIFYTLVDAVYTTLYITLGERFLVKSPLEVEVWRPILKAAIEYYIPIKELYFRQFCLVEYHGTPPTSSLRTN